LNQFDYTKIFRFLIVGIGNTGISYVTFSILFHLSGEYMISSFIAYIVAVINSFIYNKNWVFIHNDTTDAKLIILFLTVNIISLLANLTTLYTAVELFNINPYLAQVLATIAVMHINFIGYKFIFR
jgi:putative flippase GtrA